MNTNRIFIASQNPAEAAQWSLLMERSGFCVLGTSEAANDANLRCRQLFPDIFLTSQRLRGGTGMEVAELLQDVTQCVVLMDGECLGLPAPESGVVYLQKPVSPEILVNTMNVLSRTSVAVHSLQDRITSLEEDLQELKDVHRAKTLVMRLFTMAEDEAYDFLRKVAMNRRVRLGQAAQWILQEYENHR